MADPDLQWLRSGGLEEARERCDEATEGPWKVVEEPQLSVRHGHDAPTDAEVCTFGRFTLEWQELNAAFIAHARTDLPTALSLLERVGEALASFTWEHFNEEIAEPLGWGTERDQELADVLAALRDHAREDGDG